MLINIGFGNLVHSDRVLAIVRPDAAPVKRMIAKAKTDSMIIDATQGRKTKSVIILDEGHILLSVLQPETIHKRFRNLNPEKEEMEEQDE
jgi:hypothetical protein